MTPERLNEILERISEIRIAVIGDFFLDRYFDIDRSLAETSLETGLEAHQVVNVRCYPGAAGNTAANFAALGAGKVYAVGAIGYDGEGFELRREFERMGVKEDFLIRTPDLRTPSYNKSMLGEPGKAPRELERLDIKNRRPMLKEIEERTIALLPQIFDLTDGILVGDQVDDPNCGLITDKVRDAICRMGKEHPGKPILADSRARIAKFRNVMIKPNRSEAFKTAGLEGKDDGSDAAIVAAGGELSRRAGRPVFITLGEEGTYAFSGDESEKVPAYCLTGEIDICGAGDTAASAIVSSLCAGATWREAALIGNLAASLSIEQIGVTGTASPEALRKRLQEYSGQQ